MDDPKLSLWWWLSVCNGCAFGTVFAVQERWLLAVLFLAMVTIRLAQAEHWKQKGHR